MSGARFLKGLRSYLSAGIPESGHWLLRQRAELINGFGLLGLGTLIGYSYVDWALGEYVRFIVVLLSLFLTIGIIAYLRITRDVNSASTLVLVLCFAVFLFLLIDGGLGTSGFLWVFLFPGLAYFLKGQYEGTVWIAYLATALGTVLVADATALLDLPYEPIFFRQFLVALLLVTGLNYLYQLVQERQESNVVGQNQALAVTNHALVEKVHTLDTMQKRYQSVIETIDATITQVQIKNKELEDTKVALLNVLDDLEHEKSELEQAKAKDEALLSSLGEGLIATDGNRNIVLINPRAEQMLGVHREQVMGKLSSDVFDVMHEADGLVPDGEQPLSKAIESRQPVSDSGLLFLRPDGTRLPVAVTASPVILGEQVVGGILVFRDISKEKEIDRAKSEFVSLASHQLRTPLSAINWYVEMILTGDAGPLTDDQKNFLGEIYHGSQRMVKLVNALLNVSRIELSTYAVEPEPTNLSELADSVLKELTPDIEKKSLTIVRQFDPSVGLIPVDANLMRIIFQNLLSNAIKYTPAGTITCRIEPVGDQVRITVADTGIGIPQAQQHKIFEKLFRADNVKKADTDGTGLGLYIIKSILAESGGKITFVSVENKGTTMTLLLPKSGMKAKQGSRRLS